MEAVAKGEAEIGIQQTSEIIPLRGVTLVRQPPGDLQKVTTYGAAIMSDAKAAKPAAAFVGYLTGTGGVRSKGFATPRQ